MIRKGGTSLALNREAWEALGEPDRVVLLYDRRRKAVGVRPAPPEDPDAYAVGRPRGAFVVSARAFVRHYGITAEAARRYDAAVEDGVLVARVGRESDPTESPLAG
jgi:hypothetical protein